MPTLQAFTPLWLRDRDNADKPWGLKLPDGREINLNLDAVASLVSGAWKRGSPGEQISVHAGVGASPGASVFASGTAATWQLQLGVRTPFYAFRIAYWNPGPAAYTITKAVARLSTTWIDGGRPTGGTAVNITFNSGSASVVVPAGTGTDNGFIYSDWIPIAPVARTDLVGAPTLIHIRSYIDGAANVYYHGIVNATYPGNTISGLVRQCSQVPGDLTDYSAPNTFTGGNTLPMSAEFLSNAKSFRIANLGDSLASGINMTDGGRSWAHLGEQVAASLNASNTSPFVYSSMNFGWSSQTYTQVMARLPALLAAHKVDAVMFPTYSPNSLLTTQALYDANWFQFLQGIRRCLEAGVLPIVWSGTPRNSATLTEDNFRKAAAAQAAAFCAASKIIYADVGTAVGNGASPEQLKAAYDIGDGLHLNAAGNSAAGAVIAAAINAGGVW